jgi:hypothetical protein
LESAVENVNHAVRVGGTYFRYGNSAAKFSAIDSHANERLAILAGAVHGLLGRNWVSRFNYEWTSQIGVYRLSGTVRSTLALAGGERCGEPCGGNTPGSMRGGRHAGGAGRQSPKGRRASRLPDRAGT